MFECNGEYYYKKWVKADKALTKIHKLLLDHNLVIYISHNDIENADYYKQLMKEIEDIYNESN